MPATSIEYRYRLPDKAIKGDCPQCGPKHKKTLSRYIDGRTGELLPDVYGRCDRENNCGYHLSPYHRTPAGQSYSEKHSLRDSWSSLPASQPRRTQRIYTIPDNTFTESLGRYEQNTFAGLLRQHFGLGVADKLLKDFHVGTSDLWPGACVYWYIDEYGRKRGGQIKQFASDWHTVKYTDATGRRRSRTSWVHAALIRRCKDQNVPLPQWLQEYDKNAERSPCLFGLPQLQNVPPGKPAAIVEAPKTAIVCTPYFPGFVWLAAGAMSYLNADRLSPLKGRSILLCPDLNAFTDWSKRAAILRARGYNVKVWDFLELRATNEQKQAGLDLADYLIDQWEGYPPSWDI